MRLRLWAFAVAAIAVAVSGCTSNPVASPSVPTVRAATAASTPTPSLPTAAPTGVMVVATGAAASPTGTLLFVVVANGNTVAASGVEISAIAESDNGGAPLHGNAVIPNLAPGEPQAAVIALTVPSGDSLGAIIASAHATGQSTYTNPLTASEARFVDDPISPSISVSVTGSAAVRSAVVVAVCWVGTKIVGGAMRPHLAVAAGSTQTVTMHAALTASPRSCSGYARPE